MVIDVTRVIPTNDDIQKTHVSKKNVTYHEYSINKINRIKGKNVALTEGLEKLNGPK